MNRNSKAFLKNAVILTLALAIIILCMPEWGTAQVIIVLLVGLLAAVQWMLFAYIKRTK